MLVQNKRKMNINTDTRSLCKAEEEKGEGKIEDN